MHANQLTVSAQTVRELVDAQFPQWRGLSITPVVSSGTVNAIFRIGDQFAARFPLQPADLAATRRWLQAEAAAAGELAGRSRFATPRPVGLGEPGSGYPLAWSVQTWLPGVVATDADPSGSAGFAHDLAEFIADLRAIDPRGRTFSGTGRGGDLQSHDEWMETSFRRSEQILDVARLRRLWAVLRTLPRGRAPDTMTHGDLIPGNVLVRAGRLAGILDVGGLRPADPAVDLVSGWHLLDAGPRQLLREDLDCDDLDWERGKAWAFEQAVGAVWYYTETNPAMSRMGRTTLARILADSPAS